MARPIQDVTDAELSVLQALWEQPRTTIRKLAEALYPKGGSAQFATVQKLLERLEAKGFVRRDRDQSPQQFEAVVSRDQLIGRRLRMLAEELCDGSLVPMLTNLVRNQKLDERERNELRSIIDQLDKRSR